MKIREYLKEEYKVKTKKDLTGHTHIGDVNVDGDGSTLKDDTGHVHKIFQWLIQPAAGHIHNLKE
jgi:hypothetical protein